MNVPWISQEKELRFSDLIQKFEAIDKCRYIGSGTYVTEFFFMPNDRNFFDM